MTDIVFAACAGAVMLVLQTTSLAFLLPPDYKPDLILVLVVWAGLHLSVGKGVLFAFLAGVVVDTLSGSPLGLFGIVYSVLFVVCGYFMGIVRVEGLPGQCVLVFGGALWAGIAVLIARLFHGPVGMGWHVVGWLILKVTVTMIVAVALFPILDWAWTVFSRLLGDRRLVSRPTDYS